MRRRRAAWRRSVPSAAGPTVPQPRLIEQLIPLCRGLLYIKDLGGPGAGPRQSEALFELASGLRCDNGAGPRVGECVTGGGVEPVQRHDDVRHIATLTE